MLRTVSERWRLRFKQGFSRNPYLSRGFSKDSGSIKPAYANIVPRVSFNGERGVHPMEGCAEYF
jgi:hypothetical protein